MSAKLRVLMRVIQRRADNGEKLEDIFKDYPLLTESEKDTIMVAHREEQEAK